MTQRMPCAVGSGDGFSDWIDASSYPTRGMSFQWGSPAESVIISATLLNGDNAMALFYIELDTPHVIKRGAWASGTLKNITDSTQGLDITVSADKKSLTITHVNYNWSSGCILPIDNKATLSN